MPFKRFNAVIGCALLIAAGTCLLAACSAQQVGESGAVTARIRELEDREAIRGLLIDYGRTLDARDFDGFARLFARDGEYVSGGGNGAVQGPDAIGALLRRLFEANSAGVSGPNYHLFFNETIAINGDAATAISKGAFVVKGTSGRPEVLIQATYRDQLIREDGRWKFRRREVIGDFP